MALLLPVGSTDARPRGQPEAPHEGRGNHGGAQGEPPGEQKEAESPTVDTDGIAPLPANLMQRSSAQDQEAEAHREFPKYMLHPFATFRSSWDVATLFLLFVAAVQMPVVECFEVAMWTRAASRTGS